MFELLKRIRRAKLVGVTVFKGQRGQGHSGRLHESRLLFEDAPLALVVIERSERIDAFLSEVDDLIRDVFVVVDDTDIVEM
jgi:PII-like signaling protein